MNLAQKVGALLLTIAGPLAAEPAAVAPPAMPALLCTHPAGFPVASIAPGAVPAAVPWLQQLPVRAARLRGLPRPEPIDGIAGTAVPLAAPLEVELARSAPVAYAEVAGTGSLRLQCDGRTADAPTAGPAQFLLAEPVRLRRLTIPSQAEATLSEARFFECRMDAPPKPEVPMAPVTGSAPGAHLSTGPLAQAVGATAVLLDLELQAPFPEAVQVRLAQSSEAGRAWLQANLLLQGEAGAMTGRWVVVLDPPDTWCAAGDSLSLSIAAAPGGVPAVVRSAGAGVATGTLEQVREEAALSRIHWLSAWYAEHAVDAPWDRPDWAPEREPAMRWLAALREWQPQHPATVAYSCRLLRPVREVHVPAPGPENAPAWARLARQLLKRTQDIAYWWNGTRLQKDGLYGGDARRDAALVEKLSTVPLVAGHPVLLRSTRAGCEAVWRESAALAAKAGQQGTGDAAVTAWVADMGNEDRHRWLLALTQAQSLAMLAEPGNPIPLRRLLPLAGALAAWTRTNPQGHRHYGGGPDVPGNAVAAGPALAYFWHSGHPLVARVVGQWAAAWAADLAASADPKDSGRMVAGIDPLDCRVAQGLPEASPVDASALRRLLLDAHRFTGKSELLRPVALATGAGAADPLVSTLWRLTGNATQDDALVKGAQRADDLRAYAAWLATREKQFLADGLQAALDRLDAERYLATEAGLPPEAVEIPGDLLLRFLYLGGCATWQGGMPRLAVTWENTGVDFAAFVSENRRDALKVLLYHFRPEERPVQMRVWGLRSGRYLLEAGPDDDYDDVPDRVRERQVVDLERGTALPVTLPGQRPWVLRLTERALLPDVPRPDVALCADEVRLSPDRTRVSATLRNFGTAAAAGVRVAVTDERSRVLGAAVLPRLPWPHDLRPASASVQIPLKRPAPAAFRVTASVAGTEISTSNNSVVISR